MSTSTSAPARVPVVRTLRRLGSFLAPYRRRFVFAGIALLVAAGCTLAVGQGLKLVVDRGFTAGIGAELDRALFELLAIIAVMTVATYIRFYNVSWIGERVTADLRRRVFNHLLTLSPGFFEVTRTGEVISRLTNDTTMLENVIGSSLSMALRNIVLGAGALVLLMLTSLKLTLLVLGGTPGGRRADHHFRPPRSPLRPRQPGSRCRHRRLRRRGDPRNPHGSGVCARARGPARLRRTGRGGVRGRRASHPSARAA